MIRIVSASLKLFVNFGITMFPNVISVEEILFENLNKTVVSEDLEVVAPHVQNLGARLNVIRD